MNKKIDITLKKSPSKLKAIHHYIIFIDDKRYGKLTHFDISVDNMWRVYQFKNNNPHDQLYKGKFQSKEDAISYIKSIYL